jgi:hypothetical protein
MKNWRGSSPPDLFNGLLHEIAEAGEAKREAHIGDKKVMLEQVPHTFHQAAAAAAARCCPLVHVVPDHHVGRVLEEVPYPVHVVPDHHVGRVLAEVPYPAHQPARCCLLHFVIHLLPQLLSQSIFVW